MACSRSAEWRAEVAGWRGAQNLYLRTGKPLTVPGEPVAIIHISKKTTLTAMWRKVMKIIWVNNPLASISESKSFFSNSFNDKT